MGQNLISLALTEQQWNAIDGALSVLEEQLIKLMALQPSQRRMLIKMGDKSEAFCRQTLVVLEQNPQIVPPSLDVQEAKRDLTLIDDFRPRMVRLQRLAARATDTQTALGSDLMAFALEGYSLLKLSGKNQGLEELRRHLSARFNRGPRPSTEPPSTEA